MANKRIQLEILDKLADKQGAREFTEKGMPDSKRQQVYEFLKAKRYIETRGEIECTAPGKFDYRVDYVGLTAAGKQYHLDLPELIQKEEEQRQANKVNRDVRLMTLVILVLTVGSILLFLFRWWLDALTLPQ